MSAPDHGPSRPSLAVARLLPRQRRDEWRKDRAFSLIQDLNNLYFTLGGRGPDRDARAARARALLLQRLAGARWIADQLVENAWRFIREEVEDPEDAFGPAVLLLALCRENPEAARWMHDLPREVARALRAVGILDAGRA